MAFPIAGVVKQILVQAGETKKRGEPLAYLRCDELAANVQVAQAELRERQAALEKTRRGARAEEVAVSEAKVAVARAERQATKRKLDRAEDLRRSGGFISDAEVDAARDLVLTAEARLRAAEAELRLLVAPARAEDLMLLSARTASMQSQLAGANAELEKCVIRAPADITVLKVFVEVGDAVAPGVPPAVVSGASLSKKRVRAEVDERDVRDIRVGQAALITSEFNPRLRLTGRVSGIELQMGRRSIKSSDPADKNDRDVLEAIIEIEGGGGDDLPVGLRLVVTF
jgi:multidrug resistance efflux pump